VTIVVIGMLFMNVFISPCFVCVCMRVQPGSSTKARGDFLNEASIMGQFQHDHVIKLYGVITKVDPAMIIMEFMENGSLFSYLRVSTHTHMHTHTCMHTLTYVTA